MEGIKADPVGIAKAPSLQSHRRGHVCCLRIERINCATTGDDPLLRIGGRWCLDDCSGRNRAAAKSHEGLRDFRRLCSSSRIKRERNQRLVSNAAQVDIDLSGIGYQTLIPFALDPAGGTKAAKITQPFMAFGGGPVPAGTVVKAPTPANPQQGIIAGGGTVYSFDPEAADMASTMRLEAWGLRNPYGIGFDPFHPKLLFVSNNGADVRQTTINGKLVIRGSRPIDNDFYDMFVVRLGADHDTDRDQDSKGKGGVGREVPFFGHPDFFHDPVSRQPLPVTNPQFCPAPLPLPTPPPPVLSSPCSQFAFSDSFRAKL